MLATHRKQSNLRGYVFRYVVREPEKKKCCLEEEATGLLDSNDCGRPDRNIAGGKLGFR